MGSDFYLNPPEPINIREKVKYRAACLVYCKAAADPDTNPVQLEIFRRQMLDAYKAWGKDKYY